ncbi:hypothetical protein RJG79_04800 [Mycoplasmatota bacterium WC44]
MELAYLNKRDCINYILDNYSYIDPSELNYPSSSRLFEILFLATCWENNVATSLTYDTYNEFVEGGINNTLKPYRENPIEIYRDYFDYNSPNFLDPFKLLLKYSSELDKRTLILLDSEDGDSDYDIFIVRDEYLENTNLINSKLGTNFQRF